MIEFDGITKRITISGVSSLDVQYLYSRWKDWAITGNNTKYEQALRPSGGDSIGGGQASPAYFFLMNDWKIFIDGIYVAFSNNLYCEEASNANIDPFVIINNGSASNQVSTSPIVATGGSALTTEEHNKLMTGLQSDIWKDTTAPSSPNDKAAQLARIDKEVQKV